MKKDILPIPMTPLEKMLQDAGPLRADGSDKFFGMENVSALEFFLLIFGNLGMAGC